METKCKCCLSRSTRIGGKQPSPNPRPEYSWQGLTKGIITCIGVLDRSQLSKTTTKFNFRSLINIRPHISPNYFRAFKGRESIGKEFISLTFSQWPKVWGRGCKTTNSDLDRERASSSKYHRTWDQRRATSWWCWRRVSHQGKGQAVATKAGLCKTGPTQPAGQGT